MRFTQSAAFLAIAAALTIITPAQAQSLENIKHTCQTFSDSATHIDLSVIEKRITSKIPQKGGQANIEQLNSEVKPQRILLVEDEIQRIKPMPSKKYETYGKNIHLINYEQRVRNTQIKNGSR